MLGKDESQTTTTKELDLRERLDTPLGTPSRTNKTETNLVEHLNTPIKTHTEERYLIEALNSPVKIDMPDKVKAKDLSQVVNVSGLLNNCFFHALALYHLGNKIPLPVDLFTYSSKEDNEDLAKLKTQFPNLESLDLFTKYTVMKQFDDKYSNHWVEKTIVLGIFLRSYFVKRLLNNEENSQDLFEYKGNEEKINEKQITFMSLIENRLSSTLDNFLESVKDNPIYLANEEYFKTVTENVSDKDLKAYWFVSGYQNYCNYLNSKTNISHVDVEPVLRELEIPFNFYSYTDLSLIAKQKSEDKTTPPFVLAINVQEGHYYLQKSDVTSLVLDEYQKQHTEYLDFRVNVLATQDEDKIAQAHESSALFLAATLPSDLQNHSPLKLIVERVEEITNSLNSKLNNSEIKGNLEEKDVVEEKSSPRNDKPEEQNDLTKSSPRNNSQNQLASSDSSVESRKNETIPKEIEGSPDSDKNIKSQNGELEAIKPVMSRLDLTAINTSTQSLGSGKKHSPNSLNTPKPSPHSFRKDNTKQVVQIHVAKACLTKLSGKAADYKRKMENPIENLTESEKNAYVAKYKEAEDAASQLYSGLSLLLTTFENNSASVEAYEELKNKSLELANVYKPVLAKHRDTNSTILNFIDAIFGRGAIYGYVESVLPQLLWKTEGAKAVDNFIDSLEEIKPASVI